MKNRWIPEACTEGLLLRSGEGIAPIRCNPVFKWDGGQSSMDTWEMDLAENRMTACNADWAVSMQWSCEGDWVELRTEIRNISAEMKRIEQVGMLSDVPVGEHGLFDRVLNNGRDMVSFSSLRVDDEDIYGEAVTGFTKKDGSRALVIGYTDLSKMFCPMEIHRRDGNFYMSTGCELEMMEIPAGTSISLAPLCLGTSESLASLMGSYAQKTSGIPTGSIDDEAPTGWCSWYYYYDQMTQEDLYRELDDLEAQRDVLPVTYIQIDDGWNLDTKESPRIWGDWHAGNLFPVGMKKLADDIKRKGFKPGLWLAPFSVDKASTFYAEHPDLLVQENGEPKEIWGTYGLDLSNPGALEFLRETFTRVFDEWGFDYIKIDFLLHALIRGDRYDNTKTTAELFRQGLQVIRDVAGDRFILGCGAPMGPSIGIVDAMRIGYDVSSRWFVPVNPGAWPEGNCNIKGPAVQHVWRLWMHRTWWINDADCIMVREYGSVAEKKNFTHHFPEYADDPPYGLTADEARCWSRLVWMTSGVLMVGDSISGLDEERMGMLTDSFSHVPVLVSWVDYYESQYTPILAAADREGTIYIGIFNLTDEPIDLKIPIERISRAVGKTVNNWMELDGNSSLAIDPDSQEIRFPTVPAHGTTIWMQSKE